MRWRTRALQPPTAPAAEFRPPRSLATMLPAIVGGLLALSILGALLTGITYRSRLDAVQRSVEVQRAAARLLSAVQDAETGQRGFLLTGDPLYLAPYDRAQDAIPAALSDLSARLSEPEQRARLDAVRGRIAAKLAELRRTVELRRSGRAAAALAVVRTGLGRDAMAAVRATLAQIEAAAQAGQRAEQRAAAWRGWALLALTLLPLFAIPVLMARAGRNIRRYFAGQIGRLESNRIEARERETELGGLRDRFALVLDAATDYAIVLTGTDGVVTRWSRGAEQVTGWPSAFAEGRSAEFFFTPEDREAGVPAEEMRRAREEGQAPDERWHLRASGERFWGSGEMQPVRAADGAELGFLKIFRDRTDEKLAMEAERNRGDMLAARVDAQAAELQVAQVERAELSERHAEAEGQVRQLQKLEGLGQLTAGIAHDFNNMLAVVIGSLDLLRRKYGSEAGIARLVAAAEDGATRAAELTRRLLAFSRQQPLEPRVLDLNKLVGGMSELLRRTLGDHIQVETVLAGGLWPVNADPHEVERVLLNLAVNARDAMPGGGRLTVETSNAHLDDAYAAAHPEVAAGQYVAVCVTDTGSGMEPEVLARAFDPFFSTKTVGKGTGLGLSQMYGFAKQSNGHVKIYSEVDHGTAVKLYLPRWRGAERPTVPRAADPAAADLPRGRIDEIVLVVEDEDRVRMISVETLRELGYTVRHASSGPEALKLLDAQPGVTLIFTDIVMPGMTGRQLADAAAHVQPDARVLFTTGYTRNAVVHGGVLDAGVAFLPKPFTVEQLATKVRATIDGMGANR